VNVLDCRRTRGDKVKHARLNLVAIVGRMRIGFEVQGTSVELN